MVQDSALFTDIEWPFWPDSDSWLPIFHWALKSPHVTWLSYLNAHKWSSTFLTKHRIFLQTSWLGLDVSKTKKASYQRFVRGAHPWCLRPMKLDLPVSSVNKFCLNYQIHDYWDVAGGAPCCTVALKVHENMVPPWLISEDSKYPPEARVIRRTTTETVPARSRWQNCKHVPLKNSQHMHVTRFEATECFEKVFNLSFYVKSHNAFQFVPNKIK